MFRTILCFTAWLALAGSMLAQETASVRMADRFGVPVGLDGSKKYYMARGMRPNGHLGEDWNGVGGGNTDLGDPVYCTANGLVVYARDFRAGWGNVVIVRHAYQDGGRTRFVDSLYGHLDRISVREGQRLDRGDKVGTIGTAHGQYPAHLHFEIRKDIRIGMYRSMFPRDYRSYYSPTQFIVTHQRSGSAGRVASVPVNTFPNQSGFKAASSYADTKTKPQKAPSFRWTADTRKVTTESQSPTKKKGGFTVDRYEDLRKKK